MEFIVSSSTLSKQLATISGVVVSNPVVPILENFLFVIEDGQLTITASDLQTSLTTAMTVEAQGNASLAIPARILLDTLRNLPEQPLTFSVHTDSHSVVISSDNGRYRLAGENATDFPQPKLVQQGVAVVLPGDVLKRAIGQTVAATSRDELRPAMNGVYMDFSKTSATFVATDGHRLVRYMRSDVGVATQRPFIVPRKVLVLLKNLLSREEAVQITFNDSHVHFRLAGVSVVSRLIDERYPDYANVIPTDNPNKLTIDRMRFLSSLKRMAIYSNRTTHQVRFSLTENLLHISAEDFDFSNEANEHMPCTYEGEALSIGFNAKFLIEMLANMHAEVVEMHLSTPNKACLIFPQEKEADEDLLLLVMPVILKKPVEEVGRHGMTQ